MADDEPVTHQTRSSRWPIALAAGLAVGAGGVAAYAYTIRIPTGGRSADTTDEPSALLLTSLVLTVVAAVATLAVGWWALAGKDARPYAATLLAVSVGASGYRYLGEGSARAAAALSGPGARPAVPLAQLAWPLLVVAALVLLVGTVWSRTGSATSAVRAYLSPVTVLGVVLAVGVGGVATRAWEHRQPQPTIVAATAIPSLPTALGTDVAYTVPAEDARHVLPAGPGFIAWDGGGIQAYDGVTGAKRWHFGAEALPQDCALHDVRSTGTSANSVVVVECVRHKRYPGTDRAILTGIDANTGAALWLNDDDLKLSQIGGQSDSVVPVSRGEDVGTLDPRTGALRWLAAGAGKRCGGSADVVRDDLVVGPCSRDTVLRVLDGHTGAQREIDLKPYLPKAGLQDLFTLAADGDTLVVGAKFEGAVRSYGGRPPDFGTLAIDVPSGSVSPVPSATYSDPRAPHPGPLLQLGVDERDDLHVDVYDVPRRKLIRVAGVGIPRTMAGDGQLWARVGDEMVTAAATDDASMFVASVGLDGAVRHQALPCPGRTGRFELSAGILPVPGATLILCPPARDRIRGWTVTGLR